MLRLPIQKPYQIRCIKANPQFLGAPILDLPTGENTANVTISMLEAWGITVNDLFATVWDTTAVNTGVDHGACAYIEHRRSTALLWYACRHHIAEVHMTHVFDRVRGARKAPEDLVLKRMKNLWEPYQPDIDHITTFTWPQDQNPPRFRLARKTRDWAQLCMQNAGLGS